MMRFRSQICHTGAMIPMHTFMKKIKSQQWLCNSDIHFAKTLWYLWKERLTPKTKTK